MMIEPPGQAFVGTIFEIDDRIVVTIKLFAVKSVACAVHRRGIGDLGTGRDLRLVKFGENGCRRNAVEAIAVIKYAKFHMSDDTRGVPSLLLRTGSPLSS